MPSSLYCATTNSDKLREVRHALGPLYDVQRLPGLDAIDPPEETGNTFEANAALKSIYYSGYSSQLVIADDSGLEVDALNGEPGVHSARYSGVHGSNDQNNRLVLARMQGAADRSARFVCVIALASSRELIGTFRGTVDGYLLEAPRGSGGFGYDPLFFYPPLNCTFGEASLAQKSSISARGKALQSLAAYLQNAPPLATPGSSPI